MAATGTKLSQHTAYMSSTGTKLSQHREKRTFQPIRGEQGENYPGRDANNRRRESFIPQWWQCFLSTMSVGQPRHHRFHPTETCRQPKHHRFLAACTHPTDAQCARLPQNRMQFPHPPKRTTTQNVGIPMIEFQSWKYSSANCMRNCRATTKTAYKTGPVVVHRPRLVSISA